MVSQKKTQVPPLLTPLHTKTFLHHHATTRNTVSFITRVFICEHCDHEHVFTFTPSHSFASHSFQGFSFVSIVTTNTFLHSRRRTHSRLVHHQGFYLWALWPRTRFYIHAVALIRVSFISRVFICEHCDHEHVFTFTPSHSFASHSSPGFSFVSIVTTNTFLQTRRSTVTLTYYSTPLPHTIHTPFTHHSTAMTPQWHHNYSRASPSM